ncbi:MAG: enoyl-CoA hydratase/isomerase family protein [Alphaproteobacteria bacterium]
MSDRYAKYERLAIDWPADRVMRITMNRPEKLNALDAKGHREITYIWREIDMDPDVSAVILTGAGKAFSAGGDLDMVKANTEDWEAMIRTFKEARDLVYNVINCGKPTIAAINGVAVGAGLCAGILCDIPLVGKSARIMDGHTRLGVAAGDHAAIIWPLLCGMARAKYYLMTCEPITGEVAADIGMAVECLDDDKLQDRAIEIATRLAKGAPTAIRFTKYALNNWFRMMGPTFDASTGLEMMGMKGPEVIEGMTAIREKRAPNFNPKIDF